MQNSIIVTLALGAGLALTVPAGSRDLGIKLGLLDCAVTGESGTIFEQKESLSCAFTPADGSLTPETYKGSVTEYGLELGKADKQMLQWTVLAPSNDVYKPGLLAGDYVGASAEVTAAVGAGVNLLIGGSQKAFTLQPVSITEQTGLNLAVGVTKFKLETSAN